MIRESAFGLILDRACYLRSLVETDSEAKATDLVSDSASQRILPGVTGWCGQKLPPPHPVVIPASASAFMPPSTTEDSSSVKWPVWLPGSAAPGGTERPERPAQRRSGPYQVFAGGWEPLAIPASDNGIDVTVNDTPGLDAPTATETITRTTVRRMRRVS